MDKSISKDSQVLSSVVSPSNRIDTKKMKLETNNQELQSSSSCTGSLQYIKLCKEKITTCTDVTKLGEIYIKNTKYTLT